MRTYILFTVTHVTAIVAGILMASSLNLESTALAMTFVVAGLGLALGPAAFGIFMLCRAVSKLSGTTVRRKSNAEIKTGLFEFDELVEKFTDAIEDAFSSSEASRSEIAEMNALLSQFDRRTPSERDRGNSCVDQLKGLLGSLGSDLESEIRQSLSCGREIERSTEQIVVSTDQQADAVGRTAVFVEKISSEIDSVCENATAAVDAASSARQSATQGLELIQQLSTEMAMIKDHVAAREKKLRVLGDHTKEIGSIVETIGTISSSTDMLALNASIESVRAGEHGRGFAIVAEEVRSLAEQAAQAARDVSNRIESIQVETRQSIAITADEHNKVESAIGRVNAASKALQEICDSAQASAGSTKHISQSTQQQLHLIQDVVSVMERFADVTKTNRSQAEGVRWTAKSLLKLGEQINSTLSAFRSANTDGHHLSSPPRESHNGTGHRSHETTEEKIAADVQEAAHSLAQVARPPQPTGQQAVRN